MSGSSCGFGGGFIKLLVVEDDDVEEAGDALADEHDWLRGTGGVDVVCFAGLEGADVERILIPLLVCFVEEDAGSGDGERLPLPLDDVDDAEDIFSTLILVGDSKLILLTVWDLFGMDDVEVADVTTTDEDVLGLLDTLAGCKITNVGPEPEDDCVRVILCPID